MVTERSYTNQSVNKASMAGKLTSEGCSEEDIFSKSARKFENYKLRPQLPSKSAPKLCACAVNILTIEFRIDKCCESAVCA